MDNLQKLVNRAEKVLGDHGLAVQWIETPKRALNEQKPIDLATTDAGLNEVLHLLGRIEHGVFS
jgi:putative toxin-antitoxin system antitoxin component (TIGR02293 family)